MNEIKLSELIDVSRNCGITNRLHDKLNEQLDDEAKVLFLQWLKIIVEEQSIRSNNRLKRFRNYHG